MNKFKQALEAYNKGNFTKASILFKSLLHYKHKEILYYNMGLCYMSLHQYKMAIHYFKKCKDPQHLYELSLCYLHSGDLKQGKKYYKYRYYRSTKDSVSFPNLPIHFTDNIDDKRVLILNEQGFGDEIMFMREIYSISKRVKFAYVQVYPELYDFFKNNVILSNIRFFTERSFGMDFVSNFDCYTSLGELFSFNPIDDNTRIPLSVNRVGFVCEANPRGSSYKAKSLDVKFFEELSSTYTMVNLHNSIKYEFAENHEINNFDDLSRIIGSCDIIISIDTSVIHLALFMGKYSVLAYKHYLDWRWKHLYKYTNKLKQEKK